MSNRASLLAVDADLGSSLRGQRLHMAQRDLAVRIEHIELGDWIPRPDELGANDGLGLLIVSGYMLRRIQLGHRAAAEILGPGDLLRPWQDDGEHAVYPFSPTWHLLQRIGVAVIDRHVTTRLGPFPEITSELFGRLLNRSRRVVGHLVLSQLASVEHRVLLALWHMADDWGRVRPDGVVVPITLKHSDLGLLVGARRPAVTTAIGSLAQNERLTVLSKGGFLLMGDPPEDLPLRRGTLRGYVAQSPVSGSRAPR